MNISCRGRYATRAMLALAVSEPNKPVPLRQIAVDQEISPKYLQQVMSTLARVGLVRVVKGFRGGFMLAKPADEIRISEILRALEGEFDLVECVRDEALCSRSPICQSRNLWSTASKVLEDYFSSVTLADVLAGEV